VLADDVQGVPERWGCLCLVGGHERAEQPVVELGVEDGELDAVGGQEVGVGALDGSRPENRCFSTSEIREIRVAHDLSPSCTSGEDHPM
jgi:hypothetical protein